jgi:Outer membrane protein beta-barrel domain
MTIPRFAAVIVVVVIAMTVFGSTAIAQGFGIKGGPTFSDFSSDALDFNNKTGFQAGAFFGGNRSGLLGWQGEGNWIRKESEVSATGNNVRADYIQAAGLLRLNIGTKSTSGFAIYGLVGPGFNFRVADEIEGFTGADTFKNFDIGLLFGGGVEITRFLIEGRYEQGLRNVNATSLTTSDVKSHSFAVLVGFRFR